MAMAEKVDKTATVFRLSAEEEEEKKQERAAPLLPSVRGAILWTLFHAANISVSFGFGTAYIMLINTIFSHPPSWLLPRHLEMTDGENALVAALAAGMLWCGAPVAAAGVLGLMLPSRRRRLRLLLAYTALVVTVAGDCIFARLISMFVSADPGGLYWKIVGTACVFMFGVMDLRCFLGLIFRGGEE